MNDRLRSIALLGAAFDGVVVVTLGLAWFVTTDRGGSAQPSPTEEPVGEPGGIPRLGGTLAVSGDRDGSFA